MAEKKAPRVARMVMFKHGVAYVERRGPAEGSFDLTFQRDEMNDVLKSLAVWAVKGNAKVTSFGFDTPEDPDISLAKRGLFFAAGEALDGLIGSLRGRAVEVDDGDGRKKGQVIGLQYRVGANGAQRAALLLRASSGRVVVVDLLAVRSIELLEDVSRERLAFVVERGEVATSGETRAVHVALEGKAEDLRVAYVVGAPAWRVSYRVVLGGDSALLMAMGLVHNPLDEDVQDVELTLTTGQPVSFVIDLYHPQIVWRPTVEESSRASAPPASHERALAEAAPSFVAAPGAARRRAPMAGLGGAAEVGALEGEDMAGGLGAAAGASTGVERGELFEYRVMSPVSLHRGGAAEVPLAAPRIKVERQRIWREGTGSHPDIVISFTNDTGLVLEEGAAVIYEEGALAGESMMPYSPAGAPVKMTYAKDLAVRVTPRLTTSVVVASVHVEESGVLEEQRIEYRHSIGVESDSAEAVKVLIELPKVTGRALAEGAPKPVEETANDYRFQVEVPAHGHAELIVTEVAPLSRRVDVESLDAHDLERWFQGKHLDEATYKALSGVIAHLAQARTLEQQKKRVEAEQTAAYAKQTKIAAQLAVLKETGPEGELRLRYVKELAAEQDKVNAAEIELRRLAQAIDEARRLAKEELDKLVSR